jgi:hypothetical protein
VVISHSGGRLSAADATNLEALRDALGSTLVGEIPPLREGQTPDEHSIDLGELLGRISPQLA